MIWTAHFWRDTAERAIKTFFQVLVATVVGDAAYSATTGLLDVAWGHVLGISALGALLSLATSVASALKSTEGAVATPSLVKTPTESSSTDGV